MFSGLPPTLRIATMARWDYEHADLKEFNAEIYGEDIAAGIDAAYQQAIQFDPDHPEYVGKQYLQALYTSGALSEAADDPLDPANTHVFLCGNPAMIGYVPPGGEPLKTPGMLPLLEEKGFTTEAEEAGPGVIRFEKYW